MDNFSSAKASKLNGKCNCTSKTFIRETDLTLVLCLISNKLNCFDERK